MEGKGTSICKKRLSVELHVSFVQKVDVLMAIIIQHRYVDSICFRARR
jgi:hypothetical protein